MVEGATFDLTVIFRMPRINKRPRGAVISVIFEEHITRGDSWREIGSSC